MDMEKDPEYKLFDGLLKQHMGLIRTLCWWHSSCSESTCKELVQDCCVSIWSHLSSLREDSNPLQQMAWVTWRCRACSRTAIDTRIPTGCPSMTAWQTRWPTTQAPTTENCWRSSLSDSPRRNTGCSPSPSKATLGKEIAEKLGMTVEAVKKMRQRIISKMAKKTQKI